MVGGGPAWLARQPLILGYVIGGILISPLTPGPAVSDLRTFEVFAEIGVILLMFSIGIEVSLRDLVRVRWVALLGGPLAIVLAIGLGLGVGTLLGWPTLQSVVIGMVVSVASTMVLTRLLAERGELHSRHGRILLGTSLVEDLAVVVMMVVMPRLGVVEGGRLLTVGLLLILVTALLVPFTYVAAKVIPALLSRVARTRNRELFLLARRTRPDVPILARAHHAGDRDRLLGAGATEVIQPEVEAASTLIRRALRHLDLPRDRVLAYLERFRDAMEVFPAVRVGGALPEVREGSVMRGDLAGRSLRDARIRERFGVTVVALTRADGELVLHPAPDVILRAGERVMVFGLPEQIAAFLREAALDHAPDGGAG